MGETYENLKIKLTSENIKNIFNTIILKKPTIGIDNISINTFKNNIDKYAMEIEHKITNECYTFSPYLENLRMKGRNSPPRLLCIPTIKDKIVLFAMKEILHEKYPNIIQTELINLKVQNIFNKIKNTDKLVFKADIKTFFDKINHFRLLVLLHKMLKDESMIELIRLAITNPIVPKYSKKIDRHKYKTYIGVPQGLAISTFLSSFYLHLIDNNMDKYDYHRYVDDILLIESKEKMPFAKQRIEMLIKSVSLEFNDEKTKIFLPNEHFCYLGYQISTEKLEIKPESIQRHIDMMFGLISNYSDLLEGKKSKPIYLSKEQLIARMLNDINEKITGAISDNKKYGWIFYFSAIRNMKILHNLNKIIRTGIYRILNKDIYDIIKIKSYVRSYYEIKWSPKGGYIHNYDIIDTFDKKMKYLNYYGYLETREYKEEEIYHLFETIKNQHLSEMLKDLGSIS